MSDRQYRSPGEQHDRHHEAPEIGLLTATKRVVGIGRFPSLAHAEQEHSLVAGVGERVVALGQHGGAPGQSRGHELGHCDSQIGEKGGDDGKARTFGGHVRPVYGLGRSCSLKNSNIVLKRAAGSDQTAWVPGKNTSRLSIRKASYRARTDRGLKTSSCSAPMRSTLPLRTNGA